MSLATFAQQCVEWVGQVYSNLGANAVPTSGGGGVGSSGNTSKGLPSTAAQYANPSQAGSLAQAGWSQVSKPSVGDIVVFQGGLLSPDTAGHIASVAGVSSSGFTVTQANSAGSSSGSPPNVATFDNSLIGQSGVSFWQAPNASAAAADATSAYQQLGGGSGTTEGLLSSSAATSAANATNASSFSLTDPSTWVSFLKVPAAYVGFFLLGLIIIGVALLNTKAGSTAARTGAKAAIA